MCYVPSLSIYKSDFVNFCNFQEILTLFVLQNYLALQTKIFSCQMFLKRQTSYSWICRFASLTGFDMVYPRGVSYVIIFFVIKVKQLIVVSCELTALGPLLKRHDWMGLITSFTITRKLSNSCMYLPSYQSCDWYKV